MKKILIALDYDPSAEKVAETGYSLARSMNAQVVLLHVITEPVYYATTEYSPVMGFTGYTYLGTSQTDSVDSLVKASELFLEHTKQFLDDPSIKTLVKEGNFADSILEAAKDEDVNLVVMGTHSRKWLEDVLLGSVTEKVLRHSTIPLLIIPTKKEK